MLGSSVAWLRLGAYRACQKFVEIRMIRSITKSCESYCDETAPKPRALTQSGMHAFVRVHSDH